MLLTIPTLVLSLFTLHSTATRLFTNTGTKSSFDTYNEEHKGTVTEVRTNSSSTALKVTQTYDQSWHGRYHAEAVVNDGYTRGDTRFYSFSFKLADDWDFTEQSFNLAQFIAPFNNACDDWMPSTMVWLVGSKLQTRRRWGNVKDSKHKPGCDKKLHTYDDVARVSAGKWHKVVIEAGWESDESGHLKMWFDGEKVVDEQGVPTTVADDKKFSFRVGLYANGWYDDKNGNPNAKGLKGDQGFRQVWYDDVVIGTRYDDVVEPAVKWKRSRLGSRVNVV